MINHNNELKRRKIGIFCGYYLPYLGGIERYVDKLSLELQKLGYEIVIVTSNHDNLPSVEKLDGRTIYRLPILNLAKSRYPIPKLNVDYKKLIRKVEQENIDVFFVNTRFHLTSMIGARMGRRMGRPVMLLEHGTGHFTVNNRWLDHVGKIYEHILTRLIKKYVDRFYGVSNACNNWLKHFAIQASGVFFNSIDPADAKQAKDLYKDTYDKDTVVITYAGRLIKEKGILNLLDAYKDVRVKCPNNKMKLLVAGTGPLLEVIKNDYRDSSVEILGWLDFEHILALFKRTDVFVYPSLYPEGLPTSILEAGLLGCAVIATPRGGTAEVITNGQHGIINDGSTAELSEAIARLVTDPVERLRLGDALKHRVEEVFTWSAVAKAVDNEIKILETGQKNAAQSSSSNSRRG